MFVQFDFPNEDRDRLVYVRAVDCTELPAEIQNQLDGAGKVYAIHDHQGARIALTRNRQMAFALARTNEMSPVSVH